MAENYRKVWERVNGDIPKGYHIHHIDGNHYNNSIDNLKLVTQEEHFWIHYNQNDSGAALMLSKGLDIPKDIIQEIKDNYRPMKRNRPQIDKSPCPHCRNQNAYRLKRYHYDNCPALKWK
jgi:hypothetical protein